MKTFGLVSLSLALVLTSVGCAAELDDGTTTDDTTTSEIAGAPHFEVWKDGAGQFHFHLLAGNKQILVTSQAYDSRTAALGGLLSVLDNGGLVSHYDVRPAADGKYYFNVVAANLQVIATSETYATKSSATRSVSSTIAAVGAYIERYENGAGARFEVFAGADGKYYFNLHAKNGATVLSSQGYTTEASALNGTFSVAENGLSATSYKVLTAADGRFYFNLMAPNGQVVATSQTYATKAAAERARDAIVVLIPTVSIL